MNQKQPDQIDVKKIVTALLRKKWLIVVTLFGFLIPIIYYNMTSPLIYKQSALVLFDTQRGPASIINPFQIDLRQNFIMNQIAMIKTRTFARKIYQNLSKGDISAFLPSESNGIPLDTASIIEARVRGGLRVESYPKADIVQIGFEYTDPLLVKKIANTAAKVLVQSNLETIRESSTNVRELVQEQLKIYKKRLADAEVALKNYKEQSNITISPDRESQEIFTRITDAEVLYNKTNSDLDAANKRLEYIQKKLSEQRKDLAPKINEVSNPWIQKLKENLMDLEMQYTALKVQNYPENHPKMLKLRDQIDQTKSNIREETLKLAKGENLIDPLSQIQKFLEESISLDIEIQTYKAQKEGLKKIIDGYNDSLKSVPEKELELVRLIREQKVAEQIYTMLLNKYEEARIAEAQNVSYIRIIDPADIPHAPIKPRKSLNILVGLILGLSFGVGLVLVIEFMDNSVKSSEDIEKITETSVIATIPKIRSNGNIKLIGRKGKNNLTTDGISNKLITELEPKSPESEAFRSLRTNIQFSGIDKEKKSILITSPNPAAGKSLISSNLAIAMAQIGMKTVLIDADLRKPVQHDLFKIDREPGLVDLMVSVRAIVKKYIQQSEDDQSKNDNLHPDGKKVHSYIKEAISNIAKPTTIDKLHIITSGIIPPNPSEILASKIFRLIFQVLNKEYDIIIIDTPPILAITDAAIISSFIDGVLLVVRSGKDNQIDIQKSEESVKRVGGQLFGTILNGVDSSGSYYYHYYYAMDNWKKKKESVKKNTIKIQ